MKNTIKQLQIYEIENGFKIEIGSRCTDNLEIYVFQSFTELVNFLNKYFKHRNDNILIDYNNQTSITLNQ